MDEVISNLTITGCTASFEEVLAAISGDRKMEDYIERLQVECLRQWASNHSEHCTNVVTFHEDCRNPLPNILRNLGMERVNELWAKV
jgi:hypothetical protein